MHWIEIIIVALVVLAASAYLVRSWRRHFEKDESGCGCGSKDCKVPKPKIGGNGNRPDA